MKCQDINPIPLNCLIAGIKKETKNNIYCSKCNFVSTWDN